MLDTERARQAQAAARPQVVGSVQQAMAPARDSGGGLGARAAIEHFFGGVTLIGADGVGRVGLGRVSGSNRGDAAPRTVGERAATAR